MVWISVGILIVQIGVAVISYLTLHRHRVVYAIKTAVLRMPQGTFSDTYTGVLETDHIDKELRSGKYTILQIVERHADKDYEIILGRIKK